MLARLGEELTQAIVSVHVVFGFHMGYVVVVNHFLFAWTILRML